MHGLMLLPVWLLLGTFAASAWSWSKDGFVDSILARYGRFDQAARADTVKDGVITENEFSNSLYRQADVSGNNDNQVSRDEFIDYYAQRFNISSELATVMFNILNDPKSNDDVITADDVSLPSFSGRDYATVAEFREGLEKWLKQSAEKLYTVLMSPHVVGQEREPELKYDYIINSVDTNSDGTISVEELNNEISRFSPNKPAKRRDWVWRYTQRYGAEPVTANLDFDYWDRNRDLELTSSDLQILAEEMDLNGDKKVERDEFLRFVERGYKLSKRMIGAQISLTMIRCTDPWCYLLVLFAAEMVKMFRTSMGWSPNIDAGRAAMDFDDDLNGWVTLADLRRWLNIFDEDDDGSVSRREHSKFHTERYGVNSTVASAMFDLSDINGDDMLSEKDWEFHFSDGFSLSYCDAKRSIQDLTRMAEEFRGIRQLPLPYIQDGFSLALRCIRTSAVSLISKKRLQCLWSEFWLILNKYFKKNLARERNGEKCFFVNEGRELRNSMQRRLQEELTWYLQNRQQQASSNQGRGSGGDVTNRKQDLCGSRVTCYIGESREAWWRPDAWLWWGMKESIRPMDGPSRGQVGGVYSPVGGITTPVGGASSQTGGFSTPIGQIGGIPRPVGGITSPIGGASGLTGGFSAPIGQIGGIPRPISDVPIPVLDTSAAMFVQPPWPGLNIGSMGGLGAFPRFRRAVENEASKPKSDKSINNQYFSTYHRLFSPFSKSETEQTPAPSMPENNLRTQELPLDDQQNVQRQAPDMSVSSNVDEKEDERLNVPGVRIVNSPNEEPTQKPETESAQTPEDQQSNQELFTPPFPIVGYPVVLGFDPWAFGGIPNWEVFGRKKREDTSNRDISGEGEEHRDTNQRDEDGNGTEDEIISTDVDNKTIDRDVSVDWASMMFVPPRFGIMPWDFWMTWTFDNALWDTMRLLDSLSYHGNSSYGNDSIGNDTEDLIGQSFWDEMIDSLDTDTSNVSSGSADSVDTRRRQQRSTDTEASDSEVRDEAREKRFAPFGGNMYTIYWPLLMNRWRRQFLPIFAKYWPARTPVFNDYRRLSGFAGIPGYINPWSQPFIHRNLWSPSYSSWNHLENMSNGRRFKRNIKDTNNESTDDDLEADKSNKDSEVSRRDSFKDSSSSSSSDGTTDSVWRSASSSARDKVAWKEQYGKGTSQRNLDSSGGYDYAATNWPNENNPTPVRPSQPGWLRNILSGTGAELTTPKLVTQLGDTYGRPYSFSEEELIKQRLLNSMVPRTFLSSLLTPVPVWPGWDEAFGHNLRFGPGNINLNEVTDPMPDFPMWMNQWQMNFDEGPSDWLSLRDATSNFRNLDNFWKIWFGRFSRDTNEPKEANSEDEGEGDKQSSREKRDAESGEEAKKRRWNNIYRSEDSPSLPSWTYWFLHPWCQSYGKAIRYLRDAAECDENVQENITRRSPTEETDKNKRWDEFNEEKKFDYSWMSAVLNLLCPSLWQSKLDYSFQDAVTNPSEIYSYQQLRKKREAISDPRIQGKDPVVDNAQVKREQWRNWHGADYDCMEWISPTSAWSPWKGWNLLRSTRENVNTEEAGSEDRITSSAEAKRSDDKKTRAVRCRSWHRRTSSENNEDSNSPVDLHGLRGGSDEKSKEGVNFEVRQKRNAPDDDRSKREGQTSYQFSRMFPLFPNSRSSSWDGWSYPQFGQNSMSWPRFETYSTPGYYSTWDDAYGPVRGPRTSGYGINKNDKTVQERQKRQAGFYEGYKRFLNNREPGLYGSGLAGESGWSGNVYRSSLNLGSYSNGQRTYSGYADHVIPRTDSFLHGWVRRYRSMQNNEAVKKEENPVDEAETKDRYKRTVHERFNYPHGTISQAQLMRYLFGDTKEQFYPQARNWPFRMSHRNANTKTDVEDKQKRFAVPESFSPDTWNWWTQPFIPQFKPWLPSQWFDLNNPWRYSREAEDFESNIDLSMKGDEKEAADGKRTKRGEGQSSLYSELPGITDSNSWRYASYRQPFYYQNWEILPPACIGGWCGPSSFWKTWRFSRDSHKDEHDTTAKEEGKDDLTPNKISDNSGYFPESASSDKSNIFNDKTSSQQDKPSGSERIMGKDPQESTDNLETTRQARGNPAQESSGRTKRDAEETKTKRWYEQQQFPQYSKSPFWQSYPQNSGQSWYRYSSNYFAPFTSPWNQNSALDSYGNPENIWNSIRYSRGSSVAHEKIERKKRDDQENIERSRRWQTWGRSPWSFGEKSEDRFSQQDFRLHPGSVFGANSRFIPLPKDSLWGQFRHKRETNKSDIRNKRITSWDPLFNNLDYYWDNFYTNPYPTFWGYLWRSGQPATTNIWSLRYPRTSHLRGKSGSKDKSESESRNKRWQEGYVLSDWQAPEWRFNGLPYILTSHRTGGLTQFESMRNREEWNPFRYIRQTNGKEAGKEDYENRNKRSTVTDNKAKRWLENYWDSFANSWPENWNLYKIEDEVRRSYSWMPDEQWGLDHNKGFYRYPRDSAETGSKERDKREANEETKARRWQGSEWHQPMNWFGNQKNPYNPLHNWGRGWAFDRPPFWGSTSQKNTNFGRSARQTQTTDQSLAKDGSKRSSEWDPWGRLWYDDSFQNFGLNSWDTGLGFHTNPWSWGDVSRMNGWSFMRSPRTASGKADEMKADTEDKIRNKRQTGWNGILDGNWNKNWFSGGSPESVYSNNGGVFPSSSVSSWLPYMGINPFWASINTQSPARHFRDATPTQEGEKREVRDTSQKKRENFYRAYQNERNFLDHFKQNWFNSYASDDVNPWNPFFRSYGGLPAQRFYRDTKKRNDNTETEFLNDESSDTLRKKRFTNYFWDNGNYPPINYGNSWINNPTIPSVYNWPGSASPWYVWYTPLYFRNPRSNLLFYEALRNLRHTDDLENNRTAKQESVKSEAKRQKRWPSWYGNPAAHENIFGNDVSSAIQYPSMYTVRPDWFDGGQHFFTFWNPAGSRRGGSEQSIYGPMRGPRKVEDQQTEGQEKHKREAQISGPVWDGYKIIYNDKWNDVRSSFINPWSNEYGQWWNMNSYVPEHKWKIPSSNPWVNRFARYSNTQSKRSHDNSEQITDNEQETKPQRDIEMETRSQLDEEMETRSQQSKEMNTRSQQDLETVTRSQQGKEMETRSQQNKEMEARSRQDQEMETRTHQDQEMEARSRQDKGMEARSQQGKEMDTRSQQDLETVTRSRQDQEMGTRSQRDKETETRQKRSVEEVDDSTQNKRWWWSDASGNMAPQSGKQGGIESGFISPWQYTTWYPPLSSHFWSDGKLRMPFRRKRGAKVDKSLTSKRQAQIDPLSDSDYSRLGWGKPFVGQQRSYSWRPESIHRKFDGIQNPDRRLWVGTESQIGPHKMNMGNQGGSYWRNMGNQGGPYWRDFGKQDGPYWGDVGYQDGPHRTNVGDQAGSYWRNMGNKENPYWGNKGYPSQFGKKRAIANSLRSKRSWYTAGNRQPWEQSSGNLNRYFSTHVNPFAGDHPWYRDFSYGRARNEGTSPYIRYPRKTEGASENRK